MLKHTIVINLSHCELPISDSMAYNAALSHVKLKTAPHVCEKVMIKPHTLSRGKSDVDVTNMCVFT